MEKGFWLLFPRTREALVCRNQIKMQTPRRMAPRNDQEIGLFSKLSGRPSRVKQRLTRSVIAERNGEGDFGRGGIFELIEDLDGYRVLAGF